MRKKMLFSVTILALLITVPHYSLGMQGETARCGCYCGALLSPPCSDEACKRACGWKGSDSSSGGSSSTLRDMQLQAAGQLGTALGNLLVQWLLGPESDPQAKLQKREQERKMMEELQRRQAEAERQHREEEARRLAEMYNRLSSKLKLSGLPKLQMKGVADKGPRLRLKLGDSSSGQTMEPSIVTDGTALASVNKPKLQLKLGNNTITTFDQVAAIDPSKMTPQQMADAFEIFSNLPPEEQQRILNMAQKNAQTANGSSIKLNSSSTLAMLQKQADASQTAATAPNLEEASAMARAGFDQPLGPAPAQPDNGTGTSTISVPNNSKIVDLRPRQGYSVTAADPANPGDVLPIIGDPNVVDLRDKQAPYIVDPKVVKGGTQPLAAQPTVPKVSATVSPVASAGSAKTTEFLFPGKQTFPKNPGKPLLNPLIELPKGESLPQKGETTDEFYGRLEKINLSRKIANEEYHELLFGAAAGNTPYPRGQNPVVDKIVDDAIEQNAEREARRIHDACQRAVTDMNAALAEMEKKGIIRPGEDIKGKEEIDVVYEQAIMPVRNRIYDQLEKDIRAAKFKSEHDLWVLKQFINQTQTSAALGGPSDKDLKDPAQMKRLLKEFMTSYSGNDTK
jgi:hypothetical protein